MQGEHCGRCRRCGTRRNNGGTGRGSFDDDEVAQVFQFRKDWLYLLPDRRMDKENTRTAVIEHIDVVFGAQHGVHGNSDSPYFDGAKEGGGELWSIKQEEGDALFHLDTQVEETIANAVSEFGDLGIGVGCSLVKNGGFRTLSL